MKKLLLLLLFLIPKMVMAASCYVNTEVEEGHIGMRYSQELNQQIDAKKCNNKDILFVRYVFAELNPVAVASSIFTVMSWNCNISKSIEYDIVSGNLVCELKKNEPGWLGR